jgi:hypothetical protein
MRWFKNSSQNVSAVGSQTSGSSQDSTKLVDDGEIRCFAFRRQLQRSKGIQNHVQDGIYDGHIVAIVIHNRRKALHVPVHGVVERHNRDVIVGVHGHLVGGGVDVHGLPKVAANQPYLARGRATCNKGGEGCRKKSRRKIGLKEGCWVFYSCRHDWREVSLEKGSLSSSHDD